jgi:endonuclease/exonuclease/phosphatase (EEP) superfamily protein YafD
LLVAAILNAFLVMPWYQGKPVATPGTPLTLMHANVLASNSDYKRLIDLVRKEAPDVVFLQEITSSWVIALQELKDDYPHMYAEPRVGNFGIAALSRLPFDSIRHVDSPPFGYPTIFAQVTVNDEQFNLVSSHPTIPLGRRLYEARNEQLQNIGEIVSMLQGKVVLLGDFNASLWCPRFKQLETTVQLRNARQGFGILPTWPAFFPPAMIPIDHALVSKEISVLDIRTGPRIGSDHLPLIVTVSL